MPLPTFSEWPDIPSRSAPEADFDAKMYAVFQFMAGTYRDEFLAFAAFLEANSTVVGGALNATTIGLTTPAAGKFTTLLASTWAGTAVNGGPGAIIERGTNANGEYVRFADGTQLCWYRLSLGSILSAGSSTFADPYRSAPIGWTFPAVFVANPVVSGIAETTNSADHTGRANYVRCGAPGTTSVTAVQAFRASASNIDMTVDANLMAIGRWF